MNHAERTTTPASLANTRPTTVKQSRAGPAARPPTSHTSESSLVSRLGGAALAGGAGFAFAGWAGFAGVCEGGGVGAALPAPLPAAVGAACCRPAPGAPEGRGPLAPEGALPGASATGVGEDLRGSGATCRGGWGGGREGVVSVFFLGRRGGA
jgi:hypothetical protein